MKYLILITAVLLLLAGTRTCYAAFPLKNTALSPTTTVHPSLVKQYTAKTDTVIIGKGKRVVIANKQFYELPSKLGLGFAITGMFLVLFGSLYMLSFLGFLAAVFGLTAIVFGIISLSIKRKKILSIVNILIGLGVILGGVSVFVAYLFKN